MKCSHGSRPSIPQYMDSQGQTATSFGIGFAKIILIFILC